MAQYNHNAWAYQLPDPLGSVRQLLDAQNKVLLAQSYDPFGNVIQRSAVGSQRSLFGYTGQQVDSTGLVYLRARYYDSLTGRFITKDPFPGVDDLSQTQNAYVYGLNNPIRYTDPNGENPLAACLALAFADGPAPFVDGLCVLGALFILYTGVTIAQNVDIPSNFTPPFPSSPPQYDPLPPFTLRPCSDPAYIPGPTLEDIATGVFTFPLNEGNLGPQALEFPETTLDLPPFFTSRWQKLKNEYGEVIEVRELKDSEVRNRGLHEEKKQFPGTRATDTIYEDRYGGTWIRRKGGPLIEFP